MAKTRAQRKAERRAREERAAREAERSRDADSRAQAKTQMPETADVIEAELAEEGANLDELAAETTETADSQRAAQAPDGAEAQEAPPKKRRRLRSPAPSRADVGKVEDAQAEAPTDDKISRRARRAEEKDKERRRRESAKRREAPTQPTERQRSRVIAFFISCWAELKRVQWPDRDTLIQASTVTLIFIAVAAAYLGALDALFNFLVQRLL
jgi:preprotein translocase SecE subunit